MAWDNKLDEEGQDTLGKMPFIPLVQTASKHSFN